MELWTMVDRDPIPTDEDLDVLLHTEGKAELVNGTVIMAPAGYVHEILIVAFATALELFLRESPVGVVAGSNLGFRMRNGNVRCPDLSFISTQRLAENVDHGSGFLWGAPDLAVEVLSPSDSVREMREKAEEYFENGCRMCWIVDPDQATILALRPGATELVLTRYDTLDGDEIVPGFAMPISQLFERLDALKR